MRTSVAPLFCKRHSGFKRPLKMIETGKYSTFKGPISNRDYHDAVFLGTLLQTNSSFFFTLVYKHGHSCEKGYKYPKTLNRKPHIKVCENISIHYAEVDIT